MGKGCARALKGCPLRGAKDLGDCGVVGDSGRGSESDTIRDMIRGTSRAAIRGLARPLCNFMANKGPDLPLSPIA